jgi:TRAP transporter 4TM/12TM fusion protein
MKFDTIKSKTLLVLAVFTSLFHIYFLGFSTMNTWSFRIYHVCFAMAVIVLMKASKTKYNALNIAIDSLLILATAATSIYLVANVDRLAMFLQFKPNNWDILVCIIGVILVLETTRRINGNTMVILAVVFILYALLGNYLPQMFGHKGYSYRRLFPYLYSIDGVFGTAVNVSSTYMILFVLFGAVLEGTGGGKLFVSASIAGFGRFRGGPAKAAVLASAGMGMISGSSAGNVVTTGSFTIPLMKKVGYRPQFAGAVEAVASTGGQIMPPIMGAAAFVLAETLGIPYRKVAIAGILPAILYFLSVFIMVDCEARRTNLIPLKKEELPVMKEILSEVGHLIIPILVLLYILLIENATPIKAGLYGVFSCLIVAMFKKSTRYGFKQLIDMLATGTKSAAGVVSACACAGIIVGVLALTGLGTRMVGLVLTLSGGNLIICLVLTMVVTLILGMGLPTTASYIVCSSVIAPALIKFGIEPLVAHFFIFYFAWLSAITPPVAIASYAAAGLADANPNSTGWEAFKLGLAAFIVPYMLVFSNALLLIGSTGTIIQSTITAIIGVIIFGMGIGGWVVHNANMTVRIVTVIASLLMIDQGLMTDIIGLALFAVVVILQKFVFKDKKPTVAA